jgi:putative transposase
MPDNRPPLTPGNFYHIYNRGNNHENIFIQARNYAYFMELWWKHTYPVADTWAYCLMRNHFHAVVYIKNDANRAGLKLKDPSRHFSNFFNAYARGVNIATRRTGALFERPFERKQVGGENHLMRLVVYVHQNPQKHKFMDDFRDWQHSSYPELIANTPTRLQRTRLMEVFGSRDDFIRFHQEIQPLEGFDTEQT